MTATFDHLRDAVLHLPAGDQMRLVSLVVMQATAAHPGIDFQDGVCGGAALLE
ncbi:MAG: hypothetical protein JNM65_20190 [Verrucomicrobiaceae bacterium]|nr:hypothetical protein [Verrucomicrobiaceae bacterium]